MIVGLLTILLWIYDTICFMNCDSVFRSHYSVFHDKNVLFMQHKIMIVCRRVAVVSYINVFFSVLHKLLCNKPNYLMLLIILLIILSLKSLL